MTETNDRGGTAPDGDAAHAGEPNPEPTGAPADGQTTGPADPVAADGPRKGLKQVVADDFSLAESLGGTRGVVEAVLPGVVFVTAFVITRELMIPLVASLGVAVVTCLVRLIQRTPVTQAVSGLLGVAIGAVWAWRSGDARDVYAWGLYVNAAYVTAIVVAILVRWAPIGVLVELLRGRDMGWRTDPERAAMRRRYVIASWMWAGVFALRLLVQVPLYLADAVAALGVARLVMGLPLFALAAFLTWALVREPPSAKAPAEVEADERP